MATNKQWQNQVASFVREYLHDVGYHESLSVFQKEHFSRGNSFTKFAVVSTQGHQATEIIASLLEHFDRGERAAFFNLWDANLKDNTKASDDALKIEFFCSIHFAIFPINPCIRNDIPKSAPNLALETFKAFLETRGSELSKTPEFLAYYALPYMSDPQSHPTLSYLFTPEWYQEKRKILVDFVKREITGTVMPKLEESLLALEELKARESNLVKRFQTLQADYHNLLSVSTELVSAIGSSLNGQSISQEYLEYVVDKMQIFRRKGQPSTVCSPRYLNYDKLKTVLAGENQSNNRQRQLLLSALKCRILQKQTPQQKRLVVKTYIDYDIFGLLSGQPLFGLFSMRSPEVCEQAIKLANLLCCFCSGRLYFSTLEKRFVTLVVGVVRHANVSHCAIQNALGVLEKMSLRQTTQRLLIRMGFVRDLVGLLQDGELINDTIVIYISAQLMNLCMRRAGRHAAAEIGDRFLASLCELLESEDVLVRAYVHGVCFSALDSKALRRKAVSIGMHELLTCLRDSAQPPLLNQLNNILTKFKKNGGGTRGNKENSGDANGGNSKSDGEDGGEDDDNDDGESSGRDSDGELPLDTETGATDGSSGAAKALFAADETEDFEEEFEQDDTHDDLESDREVHLREGEQAGDELLTAYEVPDCRSQGRISFKASSHAPAALRRSDASAVSVRMPSPSAHPLVAVPVSAAVRGAGMSSSSLPPIQQQQQQQHALHQSSAARQPLPPMPPSASLKSSSSFFTGPMPLSRPSTAVEPSNLGGASSSHLASAGAGASGLWTTRSRQDLGDSNQRRTYTQQKHTLASDAASHLPHDSLTAVSNPGDGSNSSSSTAGLGARNGGLH